MPGYIVLYNLTEDGREKIKDLPEKIKRGKAESEQMGIHVVGVWATLGPYDLVAVVDAPDDHTLASRLLTSDLAGNVTTQTMRAFSEDEFAQIVSKLP